MNWAAWGPTIVSLVTAIFIAGMMNQKLKDHDQKFIVHDTEIEAVKVRVGLGEIEIAKLQAWRDGYNAASNRPHSDYAGGA